KTRNSVLGLYINGNFYRLTDVYNESRKDVTIYRSDYYTSNEYLSVSRNLWDSQLITTVLVYDDFRNDANTRSLKITSGHIMRNAWGVGSWQKMATASVHSGFSGGPIINRHNNKIIGVIQQRYEALNNAVIMLSQEELVAIMDK